jgi:ZIP family zinc transporter
MDKISISALILLIFTFLGSLLTLVFRKVSYESVNYSLAFSGGIMLTASFTSLIIPSLEFGKLSLTISGIILGMFSIYLFEKFIPHMEFVEIKNKTEKSIFLIVSTVIIHNLPEGLAVGVALENDIDKGFYTALAIGIQDIPEGFVVSLPLIYITGKKIIPIFIGFLSGLSETVFAFLGLKTFSIYKMLLPFGLSFAGGAMLFVVIKDIIPMILKGGNRGIIAVSFILGLLIMFFLDNIKL